MTSLPAPLRDFVTGLGIVALVLVVVRLFDPRGIGPETWVLLPVGAGLFMMRQGVRRMVLRQVEGRARAEGGQADRTADASSSSAVPPAPPRPWQEDPVRVVALGLLVVAALAALAFL